MDRGVHGFCEELWLQTRAGGFAVGRVARFFVGGRKAGVDIGLVMAEVPRRSEPVHYCFY